MFAFIEHGQPHNHHGGENTITLSHASVRRPCQKLTKSLTPQVRASKNISTLGRRSLRPSQRHQNPTLQIVAVKYGLHGPNKPKNSPYFTATWVGIWGPGMYRKWLWSQKESEPFIYPMERATGIEPASSAWKAGVLPLNYARKIWSGRQDLNLRHPAPKAGALPNCATSRRC